MCYAFKHTIYYMLYVVVCFYECVVCVNFVVCVYC